MNVRPLRVLRDVNRNLAEQLDAEHAAEEAARFEIARSASQFSRRSREVVDGTINLSAVLMRAGEVEEANRLLAEAEREVRSEKAVLIETVNEVRAEGLERRSRITRLKLMKMLATAFLGGSLMVFSAFGVAVAKFLTDAPPSADASESNRLSGRKAGERSEGIRVSRRILVPGTAMRVSLSGRQLSDYLRMKNDPSVAPEDLRAFLLAFVPDDLVNKLVTSVAHGADETVSETTRVVAKTVEQVEGQASKDTAPTESPSAGPSESPSQEEESPTPSPSDGEEPSEPTDEGSEDDSDEDGNTMLPSPLPPVAEPGDEG
jgi:hypothetical protein